MVVPSPNLPTITPNDHKIQNFDIPIIDLSLKRSEVTKQIIKACEEYGFFKVINHGVPENIITKMEEESFKFFEKPLREKQQAGPANPFGYGCRNIGFNGDVGDVEYLLLDTNPMIISQRSKTISNCPENFSSIVSGYIQAIRSLACEILELAAEGLCVTDKSVFSKFIIDVDSDSLLRVNHYPPIKDKNDKSASSGKEEESRVGFGEHSDPQILTILRSNDVGGLEISPQVGVWVPVSPDPTAFCVNVGDVLQALTNGRFVSVRHRAMTNSHKARLSIAYFGAPPLHAKISCSPEMAAPNTSYLYKPFTWSDYKKSVYSRRLGESRIDLFKSCDEDERNV